MGGLRWVKRRAVALVGDKLFECSMKRALCKHGFAFQFVEISRVDSLAQNLSGQTKSRQNPSTNVSEAEYVAPSQALSAPRI
jgi:hypothetical protein